MNLGLAARCAAGPVRHHSSQPEADAARTCDRGEPRGEAAAGDPERSALRIGTYSVYI